MNKYERRALATVNKIRRAEGRKPLKRLPKGTPDEEYSCPIARALDGGKVGIGEYVKIPPQKLQAYIAAGLEFDGDEVELAMPKSFEAFVSWFDAQDDEAARKLVQ